SVDTPLRVLLHQVHYERGHISSIESWFHLCLIEPAGSEYTRRQFTQASSLCFDYLGQFQLIGAERTDFREPPGCGENRGEGRLELVRKGIQNGSSKHLCVCA